MLTMNQAGGSGILISEHPHGRRNIINEMINAVRLFVIFSFVGVGIRMVLKYQEQATRLKNSDNQTINPNTKFQDDSNRQN